MVRIVSVYNINNSIDSFCPKVSVGKGAATHIFSRSRFYIILTFLKINQIYVKNQNSKNSNYEQTKINKLSEPIWLGTKRSYPENMEN